MRVITVANRLPVTVRVDGSEWRLVQSTGGLATALQRLHDGSQGLWVGWPGEPAKLLERVKGTLSAEFSKLRLIPVDLSQNDLNRYYDGFSNGVIWPLFHFLLDKVNLEAGLDWQCYRSVNKRFAEAVAEHYRDGDVVWVHDYQLMLVPGFLRQLVPNARIGYFLHVPFPSDDVFRILPWRTEVIESLLSADLVGFHTARYCHNFERAAAQLTSADFESGGMSFNDRHVTVGVYPIGVEVEPFEAAAADPSVVAETQRIRQANPDKRIVLGVDRLDYTKGIPRRLMTIGRLLERYPYLREKLNFIQIAVPSREKIAAYGELRRTVNELAGQVNSQFGTPIGSPIQLLYRTVSFPQLVALYCAADVMLVTPLRDGMNLVAKEYAASRTDDDGVLVLSEFAGAAAELREALTVNPYDISGTAGTLAAALEMPAEERRIRMRAMRSHVRTQDVHHWANRFLEDLNRHSRVTNQAPMPQPERLTDAVVEQFNSESERHILLDYDGTLVPFAALPELAAPDAKLIDLLTRLTGSSGNIVHVVTGRSRESIEPWLRTLPLAIHAEHGYWSRFNGQDWIANRLGPTDWKDSISPLLIQFMELMPGASIETKDVSLALHYRNADPTVVRQQLHLLRDELRTRAMDQLEVLHGAKVLEVRLRGINKGIVAHNLVSKNQNVRAILAIGDDRTDEDLFAALPPTAITVKVGRAASKARFSVPDVPSVHALLEALCR